MCVYSLSNIMYPSSILERFWDRVLVKSPDECWEWIAGKQKDGYGAIRIVRKSDGKSVKVQAHRLSYMIHKGPISEDILILHTCDNPPCCNPKHLWSGTHSDNHKDKISKGRSGQTPENMKNLLTYWKGRRHSQETLDRMRKSAMRRWTNEREEARKQGRLP